MTTFLHSRNRPIPHVLPWLLLACVSGCAKNVVKPVMEGRAGLLPRPARVLVYDPAVSAADVTENQSIIAQAFNSGGERAQREQDIGQQVAGAFATELVDGINQLGLPAERAGRYAPAPPNALLVVSEFVNVDEGNRLRRLVVGFGAGASRVDTQVLVYRFVQGRPTKLLEFETHADSGHMPGAAVTMGAGAAAQGGATAGMAAANVAVGGVKAYRSAIEQMAANSGEQAAAYLSEYFGKQGWISPDQVKKAKQ
jgi:hypothetical protein